MKFSKAQTTQLTLAGMPTRVARPRPLGRSITRLLPLLSAAATLVASASSALAANVTWDPSPGTIGVGNGAVTGGAGTWNDSTAGTPNGNWTIDGGANNIAWVNANNDTAIFGVTGGIVTLGNAITAGGLTFNVTGYTVTGSTLTLAGATPTVTVTNSADTAFISSILAGGTGLTMAGAGTLTLSGANIYTGVTTISGGTLKAGNAGALGAGGAGNETTVQSGATLDVNGQALTHHRGGGHSGSLWHYWNQSTYSGKDLNFTNVVSGAGSVTVQGGGTTRLTAANSYTGSTTINGSQLVISNSNATSGFILSNNGTLSLRSISLSFSQNITGAGNLTKDISIFGDSTIAGTNNNYTGLTTVNLSKFTLAAGGVINGTSSITILGQFAAQLVNNGAITTAAGGSFTSSTNTGFTGTANDTGVFINNSGAALNIGTGGLSVGAPFFLNSGSTFTSAAGTMAVNSNGLVTFGDATQLNTINAAGITLNAGGSVVATGAQSTVQGWINSGKIATASAGAIALAGDSSENIDFTGFNNLGLAVFKSAVYSGNITAGTNGYQFGGALATNLTVTPVLTGANALNKTGAGGLTLTAANNYSGATTVNGGTLAIAGTGSINSTSAVTIGAATLATNSLNAIGTAGSTITRSSGSAVLIYGGAGETTDRILNDTTGATFTNNGRGTLILSNNLTVPNSPVGITFNGGGSTSIQGVTGNTGATLLNFNKAGVGTLTVNGNINPGSRRCHPHAGRRPRLFQHGHDHE